MMQCSIEDLILTGISIRYYDAGTSSWQDLFSFIGNV